MLATVLPRLGLFALGAALSTCHAPTRPTTATSTATTRAAAAATSSAEAAEARTRAGSEERLFDPDVVRAEPDSAVGRIRAALEAGRPEDAAAAAAQALAHGREADLHALWWLGARADLEAGRPLEAFSTLGQLASSDHPLAPWARLRRARLLLEADAERAAEEVEPLIELEWAGREEARVLRADALVRAGRAEEAEPLLRAFLAQASEDSARASVAIPLADLLSSRDDEASKVEAVGLYRRVATRAPLTSAAREAEARIAEVLSSLPPARRRALSPTPPEDAFARAEALAAAMRHEEAEEAFGEVADRTEDEELRCRARLGQGRAVYYRRQRRRAAELLSAVARECSQVEVRAWARYLAGKGYTSAGDAERALEQFALLEEEVPQHSLADDARYRSALLDQDAGDEASMVRRLTTLPEVYPSGDMRGRARFMLAWRARRAGQLDEALRHLEASLREGPLEDREDLRGRAAYWRAVLLSELGRGDEAIEGWEQLVRAEPLTYYGQQALVRLDEASDEAHRRARQALGTPGQPGQPRLRFGWRPELDQPAFARALALLKVGAVDEGRAELSEVRAAAEGEDEELRWLEAALLDRAGAHPEAVYLTRRVLRSFMQQPPVGEHYARWRIAYPRAYESEIERAAAERPIPPQLLFAIAREESSFRPHAVSVAHAYGLTQLILPTARRFGRRIGLTVSPATLRDPAVNVRIGAEFLGWLWERYEDNPVVLPSAYNAGQGATDRWLRERPDQRLDEWIENIPYDETRRYTRRVLQTWGIYSWLDQGRLPRLRPRLPQR